MMQLAQNFWKVLNMDKMQKLKTEKNWVKVWDCRGFRACRDLKMAAKISVLRVSKSLKFCEENLDA